MGAPPAFVGRLDVTEACLRGMSRLRRTRPSKIPIYRLACEDIECPEFVSEWKRIFNRLFYAKRSDANRDRNIGFVHYPDFPLAALRFYGWNLRHFAVTSIRHNGERAGEIDSSWKLPVLHGKTTGF